jgi:hypothetical protein
MLVFCSGLIHFITKSHILLLLYFAFIQAYQYIRPFQLFVYCSVCEHPQLIDLNPLLSQLNWNLNMTTLFRYCFKFRWTGSLVRIFCSLIMNSRSIN